MDWLNARVVVDSLFRRDADMYQPQIVPYEYDAVMVRMGRFGFGMKRCDLCRIRTWVHEFTEHSIAVHHTETMREMRFKTKTIEIDDNGVGSVGNKSSPAHIMATFVAGTNTDNWQTFYTPDDYERHLFGDNGKRVVRDKRTNPDSSLDVEELIKQIDEAENMSDDQFKSLEARVLSGLIMREIMRRQGMTLKEDKGDESKNI